MPKFAFKRLSFGAVVKIFRGEAESGLKILRIFLVKISCEEGWGARCGRRGRKEFSKKCLELCERFLGSKIGFLHC